MAWPWKIRMAWLPDDEKVSKICLLVSKESTNVTDGQTDRRTDGYRAIEEINRLAALYRSYISTSSALSSPVQSIAWKDSSQEWTISLSVKWSVKLSLDAVVVALAMLWRLFTNAMKWRVITLAGCDCSRHETPLINGLHQLSGRVTQKHVLLLWRWSKQYDRVTSAAEQSEHDNKVTGATNSYP